MNQSWAITLIKSYSAISTTCYKPLMNFIPLKDGVWKSNVLIRTMVAMLNQEIDLCTRRQIVNQFSNLVGKIDKENTFDQLIRELNKGPLGLERAFYWYTNSVGVYKIINNLLRSCTHPSEIFYLQPLFKDIFLAIRKLHKKSKKQGFVCYRGGTLY